MMSTIWGGGGKQNGRFTASSPPKWTIRSWASNCPNNLATIHYSLFSETRSASNASRALVDVLRTIVARDPSLIPQLSKLVRTRNKRYIGCTPEEINLNRPDLARGDEIAQGWLVGLNIDYRDKQMIIDAACELYGLQVPGEVDVTLPNS